MLLQPRHDASQATSAADAVENLPASDDHIDRQLVVEVTPPLRAIRQDTSK